MFVFILRVAGKVDVIEQNTTLTADRLEELIRFVKDDSEGG